MKLLRAIADEASKYRNAGPLGLVELAGRYLQMHLEPPFVPRPPVARTERLVVTLTTLPSRIGSLEPVLRSLVVQSEPPDEVLLALPPLSLREGRPYALPAFLERMPRLRVLSCDRDWGPASKLLPALKHERDPDTLLVVVDDDNVYPRDLLATLLAWHRRMPDAAVGYRGWTLTPSLDWRDTPTIYGSSLRAPVPVDVVTGTWGYLVRAGFFDDAVFDYEGHPEDAFFVDDVWFNGHLERRGIPRFVVPSRTPPLPTRAAYRDGLGSRENGDGRRNNRMIQAFWGPSA